jgi:carbamoyl-phosphate synthase small subunit
MIKYSKIFNRQAMKNLIPGILMLADGTLFEGISVGEAGHICGEVVFNTAQTGYQEILTDPSYAQQIIAFTQPHIGNTGVNVSDRESNRVFAKGVIMRSFSHHASNWRSEETLQTFLQKQKIISVSDIDTRALTHHLRQFGSQSGCLMTGHIDVKQALDYARCFSGLSGKDLAREVTTSKPYHWPKNPENSKSYHIIAYDFGIKHGILNCLADRGCAVTVVPATTTARQVLALKPDGIVLSNGPGDPAACTDAIEAIQYLLKSGIPIMGICLGHQLLALASGAVSEKMRFGHHGANHPVQSLKTGCVAISSQNHGFVVSGEHLPSCLSITHRSLFDGSIAGIERRDVPAFGFQGHPEAGPGPLESRELFDYFIDLIEEAAHAKTN